LDFWQAQNQIVLYSENTDPMCQTFSFQKCDSTDGACQQTCSLSACIMHNYHIAGGIAAAYTCARGSIYALNDKKYGYGYFG